MAERVFACNQGRLGSGAERIYQDNSESEPISKPTRDAERMALPPFTVGEVKEGVLALADIPSSSGEKGWVLKHLACFLSPTYPTLLHSC